MAKVSRHLYDAVPRDPGREMLRLPEFVDEMLKRGWLGEKKGVGFYRKEPRPGVLDIEAYVPGKSTAPGVAKTLLCFFGVGQGRSLTVKTGPSLAKNAAEYRNMFEPLRQMNKAALEPGIGEYAYSTNDGSTATLSAVKGTLVLSLELKGTGLASADLEKMRAAAKKALGRI